MSRHDLVSAQTSNVCVTHHAAIAFIDVSNNLWCHFQQCPWEIGSVWAQRVGQAVSGFSCEIP